MCAKINYTFPANFPVKELAGKSFTGGVFTRVDGKFGEPDAVRFSEKIGGKTIVARIAGKPELELALASKKFAEAEKEAILKNIGVYEYRIYQNAYYEAQSAYDRASEYGYPVNESRALKLAASGLDEAANKYPLAKLYAKAESFEMSANYVKSGCGRKAKLEIKSGKNPVDAVKKMENAWNDYCLNAAMAD